MSMERTVYVVARKGSSYAKSDLAKAEGKQ